MIKNLFRLGIIAVLAAACQGSESSSHKLALYSRYLLSDTTQTDFRILSSCGKAGRMGKIYVLGEPDEARSLSSFLLTCDQFNNVDGHARPDGLLDFAGEDFCAILDELHAPYGSLVASGHKDSLTALTIRNFISAVDTTYYLNSYDVDKLGRKKSAKMVVLASSHVSSYGYFDIDSLCQIAGCNIPLVTPLHAMLDEAWTKHGKGLNIGIWSSDSTGLTGVYADVMASEKRLRGDALAEYSVISPCHDATDAMGAFLCFLRKYRNSLAEKQLSTIIVDDWTVDVTALRDAAASVKGLAQDSLIKYMPVLREDFDIIGIREAVAKTCFKLMRGRNLFTHRIAYPTIETYTTEAARGNGSYMLVGGKDNSK